MTPEEQARYEELKRHLDVDLLMISDDLAQMPMLIQDAAELVASTNSASRAARHAHDIIRAETAKRIREAERAASDKEPSETKITNLLRHIALDEEVQAAREACDQAEYSSELASGVASALREKSRIIGKISDLVVSGFLTPSSTYAEHRRTIAAQRKERNSDTTADPH